MNLNNSRKQKGGMTMHNQHQDYRKESRSILASLRAVIPPRPLEFGEALQLAELQANRLLELSDIRDWPVPTEAVATLPRIRVEPYDLLTSGMSFWDGRSWVIRLNRSEPPTRQRFTLLHEYKHIVDHHQATHLYTGSPQRTAAEQAEHAADYFAGCALMPKRLVKRAWGQLIQRPETLAQLFEVSPRAVEVRLAQLGLTEPQRRCAPSLFQHHPRRRGGRVYRRAASPNRPVALELA